MPGLKVLRKEQDHATSASQARFGVGERPRTSGWGQRACTSKKSADQWRIRVRNLYRKEGKWVFWDLRFLFDGWNSVLDLSLIKIYTFTPIICLNLLCVLKLHVYRLYSPRVPLLVRSYLNLFFFKSRPAQMRRHTALAADASRYMS